MMMHGTMNVKISPFCFTSLFIYFLFILSTLHFTLLCYSYIQITSLHFPSLLTFYRLHFPLLIFTFLNLVLKICVLPWKVPIVPSGSLFQSVMDLFTKEYFPNFTIKSHGIASYSARKNIRFSVSRNICYVRIEGGYYRLFRYNVRPYGLIQDTKALAQQGSIIELVMMSHTCQCAIISLNWASIRLLPPPFRHACALTQSETDFCYCEVHFVCR
jgi:hypothetical protein